MMIEPTIEFVEHKGAKILVVDFTPVANLGARSPEFMPAVRNAFEVAQGRISQEAPGSLRILSDFGDSTFNMEITQLAKAYAQHNTPYIKASATIGIGALQKIVVKATARLLRRTIRVFDTRAAALDWLAEQ